MNLGNDDLKINEIASGIYLKDDIWISKSKSEISYPESGNNDYFDVEDNSFWFFHRNNVLLKIINRYSNGNLILDVGGGNGYVTKALIDSGYNAYLIEPGIEGICNAKRRGVKNLINSSLQEAEFKSNSLANIGLFDVLEHIENDSDFLKKINHLLVNNGMLFITVPAYSFLWSKDDTLAGHYRRYNQKSLKKLLKNSGFSIVYKTYFFSFLVPMIFLFRRVLGLFLKKNEKEQIVNDHIVKSDLKNKIINYFTSLEMGIINKKRRIIVGSSCLIVARKNEHSV